MAQPPAYESYAAVYDQAGQSRFGLQMLDYLNELCALHRFTPDRHRALDVGCGTGTVALALARRGWEVTGMDLSPAMLARAAAKPGAAGICWLQGDMRDFRLPRPVDLALCLYDSLNHLLARQDLQAALRCIAAALRPGGFFLFDLNTERKLAEWGNSLERWTAGGIDHIWSTRYDRRHKVVTVQVTTYRRRGKGGLYERRDEQFRERAFSPATIRRALADAGLELLAEYDCLTFEPATQEAYRVAYLARKGTSN